MRAKLTEEVHKRLVSAGVDPLKTGLQSDVFQKQRTLLRHGEELKKKVVTKPVLVHAGLLRYIIHINIYTRGPIHTCYVHGAACFYPPLKGHSR